MEQFNITITENAASKLMALINESALDANEIYLRLCVVGGGCSGFQYNLFLDQDKPEDFDTVVQTQYGIQVIVDDISRKFTNNSEIDWNEDVFGGGFKINNPNAISACGCGSSFGVEGAEGGCNGCGGH